MNSPKLTYTCKKRGFSSRKQAKDARDTINSRRKKDEKRIQDVYKCPTCAEWHMTSKPKDYSRKYRRFLTNKSETMSERNRIKKLLYKENPEAVLIASEENELVYQTTLNDGIIISFRIPAMETKGAEFRDRMAAKLLIRWMAL